MVLAACAVQSSVSPVPSLTPPSTAEESIGPSASTQPTPTEMPADTGPSQIGQVIADEPMVLRSAPGTGFNSTILEGRLYPAMRFRILEGPVAASGYQWYRVRVGSLEGWAAAGTREDQLHEAWLARVENGGIAVTSESTGADLPQVYLVEPDGELTQLTDLTNDDAVAAQVLSGNVTVLTCGTDVSSLAWSSDGRALAFGFGACETNIFMLFLDGGTQRKLAFGRNVAWSPDGTRVSFGLNFAFLACREQGCEPGPWELQVAAVGGAPPVAVTRSDPFVTTSSPDWSPDGRSIAFVAALVGADSGNEVTWIVDLETGREHEVAPGRQPQWSPDGKRLLLQRIVDPPEVPGCGSCEGELWSVALEGSDEVLLGSGYDGQWSPAGDHLAFWSGFEDSHVTVANGDGSNPRVLDTPGRFLGWSPDGRQVLVWDERTLWRVPIDGAAPVQVIDSVGAFSGAWQPLLVPIAGG